MATKPIRIYLPHTLKKRILIQVVGIIEDKNVSVAGVLLEAFSYWRMPVPTHTRSGRSVTRELKPGQYVDEAGRCLFWLLTNGYIVKGKRAKLSLTCPILELVH